MSTATVVCPAWCTDHSVDVDTVAKKESHHHSTAVPVEGMGVVSLRRVDGYAGSDPAYVAVEGRYYHSDLAPSEARALGLALIAAADLAEA